MNKFIRVVANCVLFLAVSIGFLIAARAQSPEVARGLTWLANQVLPDGEVATADKPIATKQQNRAEVRQTLRLLALAPSSMAGPLVADTENNTEFLARKVIALVGSGTATNEYIDQLVQRQNDDGGFGGAPGYGSNALDTSWVVLALAEAKLAGGSSAVRARAYLLAELALDGAIAGASDVERVQSSALALLALQSSSDGASVNAVKSLSLWLLQQQGADGGWRNSTYLSALSLAALSPVTADATVRTAARNFLLARQKSDGSWNGDPFLTAVVLRAIAGQQALPSVGGGMVLGRVIDQASGQGLAGVTITLSGAQSRSVTSDAQGAYALKELAAGSYRITYTRTGYNGAVGAANLALGQTVDNGTVALTQLSVAAIVRGQVTGSAGSPLAGVTITVGGATSLSVVTDAQGRYELTGVVPGLATVSASLPGYQTATGTHTIVAGQTLGFSPALYGTVETPPATARYAGKVVATGSGAPLAGVAIDIANGVSITRASTDASGQFDLTLDPGTYSVTFSLPGYSTTSQRFVATAGSRMNAGIINLAKLRSSSAVYGRVINPAGEGIAGATVQLVGSPAVATSAADGSYRIDNISELAIPLRATATGFASQSVTLQVSGFSELMQDFTLTSQSAGSFALGDMSVTPTSVGSASDVVLTTSVSNNGNAGGTAVVQLQVLNQDRQIVGTGAVYDTAGNLVGQVALGAGQKQALRMVWNSGQHRPGDYSLHVRLLEAGSLTQATPQGVLLTERVGKVAVTGRTSFTGAITANPPVLQVGTNTPVKLSAMVQNSGNQVFDARAFTLSVVDVASSAVVHSQQVAAPAIEVSALHSLAFSEWVPAQGGNFRLELTTSEPALGKVTGTLYVGNAVTAKYKVNKLVVPTGTQPVQATIELTGQGILNGSLSDPLAPLVKIAIQKSVTYNDREAVKWSATVNNKCFGCHVQAQALVGGETNRLHATFNQAERSAIYNTIKGAQQPDGSYADVFPHSKMTATMMGMWALDAWHDKVATVVSRNAGAGALMTYQQADGRWIADDPWLGKFNHPAADTALNLKSMIGLHHTLSQTPQSVLTRYSAVPFMPNRSFLARGTVAADQAGNIYVSVKDANTVQQFKPDGTLGDSWTGIPDPRGIREARTGGGMFVASGGGLYRISAGGVKVKLNDSVMEMVIYGPDGKLYGNVWEQNRIVRMNDSFVVEDYLYDARFSNPSRISFSPSGDLLVVSQSGRAVYRVTPAKEVELVIAGTVFDGYPIDLIQYQGGWLLSSTKGTWRINEKWEGNTLLRNRADNLNNQFIDTLIALADGRLVFAAYNMTGLKELVPQAFDVPARQAQVAASIEKGSTWLLSQDLSSNDNLAQSHQLIGLGEAARFYANDAGRRSALEAKMAPIAALLRQRQLSDGSWGVTPGHVGDAFVTAHVGYALDYLHPSPDDPYIRSAVQWLLSRQQADGSWTSENAVLSTRLAATSWVSIWLPVIINRLGGIDADMSVTFPANVKMSNPDLAPTATQANPDGSSTFQWHMTGVTGEARTLSYDLSLVDMLPEETRQVSSSAHLTFKNSFTNGVVNAPIDVPGVKASAFLALGVSTGKTGYPANTLVDITAQVTNTGGDLSGGRVSLAVYGPGKALLATLAEQPFNGLAAGASMMLASTWNTATFASAPGYTVAATLYDKQGRQVGAAQSPFAILGLASGAPLATSTLTADKLVYQPFDTVQLKARLGNTSANSAIEEASVTTTVHGPSGLQLLAKTEQLAQLAQGQYKDYAYSLPLRAGVAGNYAATLVFSAANGSVLARATAPFEVASSAQSGAGLTGTLDLGDGRLPLGDSLALSASVTNGGNATLPDLSLSLRVIDAATMQVVADMTDTQSVHAGARYDFVRNWIGAGAVGSKLIVVLYANVGGASVTLAQGNVVLLDRPVKLTVSQANAGASRVLVLVACNDDEPDTASADGTPPGCETQRARTIATAMSSLGVSHAIVTNEQAFTAAMRSGLYNTYWLSGKQDKLHDRLPAEIREAVYSGDGLILDGVHDQRNKVFDGVAGVRYRGKIGELDLPVELTAPLFESQRLVTTGRALKPELAGGTQLGFFDGSHAHSNGPGIVSNAYGSGRAVMFAFDLTSSLAAQDAWLPVLGITLKAVLPAQALDVTPGSLMRFTSTIANEARATDVRVASSLPPGSTYVDASAPGAFDKLVNKVEWGFLLGEGASSDLHLSMRAPGAVGSYALETEVNSVLNGVERPVGSRLSQPFTVSSAGQSAATFRATFAGLALTRQSDVNARKKALVLFGQAMSAFSRNTKADYALAIDKLVQVADAIEPLAVPDIVAARLHLDRILREAQWRWSEIPLP